MSVFLCDKLSTLFQSAPRERGEIRDLGHGNNDRAVSIRAPRAGRNATTNKSRSLIRCVSIRAPRAGRNRATIPCNGETIMFQSAPRERGEMQHWLLTIQNTRCFNPRPASGAKCLLQCFHGCEISFQSAPRERGEICRPSCRDCGGVFQSAPRERGEISIHCETGLRRYCFNPRPASGAKFAGGSGCCGGRYVSIRAPRAGRNLSPAFETSR